MVACGFTASRHRPLPRTRMELNLLGYSRSRELAALVEKANAAIGLDLKLRYDDSASNLLRRSDHWPFLQRGVQAVWVHTGLHPDYHTVHDDPDKINYSKMERIAKLVHRASWLAADRLTQGRRSNRSDERAVALEAFLQPA